MEVSFYDSTRARDPVVMVGGLNIKLECGNHLVSKLIPTYEEPVLNFIHDLSYEFYTMYLGSIPENPLKYSKIGPTLRNMDLPEATLYEKFIMTITEKAEKKIFDLLRDIGFNAESIHDGSYHMKILSHHIINHEYAHNGLRTRDAIITAGNLIGIPNPMSVEHLTFIHGYLHVLDSLNMQEVPSDDSLDGYDMIINCFDGGNTTEKEVGIICYENILKENQFSFLNLNKVPYCIKEEAMSDKLRQYGGDLYDLRNIYRDQLVHYRRTTHYIEPPLAAPVVAGDPLPPVPGFDLFTIQNLRARFPDYETFISETPVIRDLDLINKHVDMGPIYGAFAVRYPTCSEKDVFQMIRSVAKWIN